MVHLVVPEPPIGSQVYAPEAPRPHVVRLDLDNSVEEHHYQAEVEPVQQTPLVHHQSPPATVVQAQAPPRMIHRAPIINRGPPVEHRAVVKLHSPEAPRPHVVRLEQRRRVQPVVRVEQAPVVRVEQAPVVRVEHRVEQAPLVRVEQAPVRVHSTPRFQPSSLEVKPSAEDLTFLISQQITQSIRNRIPTILSNLQAKQSKQTKAVQPAVSRVTHTVTSTSSQVSSSAAKKGPSHHYVQNSIVGQQQRTKKEENEDIKEKMEKVDEEKMKMEMERQKVTEDEDVILPQPAPMLVEDTREHKPVWTVTRQRPKQKTTAKPRKTKIHQGGRQAVQPEAKVVKKVCWIGGGRSALTCKQVRRKLVGED